ncbi:hypothetical protein [Caballeronia grimmiae]|uniref:hypothetical protein n=1 Tax=Caballeronia grimmiae TaxID=1071679 RepID=UPI0038B87DE1
MGQPESKGEEAAAIERVANAAREVQSASEALEARFKAENDGTERTLPLARLTAAIGELQAARDALDELLARKRASLMQCSPSARRRGSVSSTTLGNVLLLTGESSKC